MEYMILAVLAVAVVIALSSVSDKLGVAPPLILMLVGVGISLLPFVNPIPIDPEWILAGILPPLLYAAAISIPTVELRRDFSAVGGLAVILVVVSAAVLGFIFHWLIPGISLPLGIALGAILSPTDAAATTIVKRLGVPGRVGTILQGESLLNDATALVLLRSAVAATAASVSFWGVIGDFLWAALAAVVIGVVVGVIGVQVRKLVHNSAPATAISLLLPFVAYAPAELIHASGLVAVVAAGITAAQLGPKRLDARQRISERANWHTVEFLLEGAVFLAMGLELYGLIVDVRQAHDTLLLAAGMAGLAIVVTLVVRWIYLAFLLRGISAKTTRKVRRRDSIKKARENLRSSSQLVQQHLDVMSQQIPPTGENQPDPGKELVGRDDRRQELLHRYPQMRTLDPAARARMRDRYEQFRTRVKRYIADVDYLIHQPLGIKEGTLLTWAGMRGVVTLAAAQTLPLGSPHRSLLILIAFFVAAGSLVIQGGTLSFVVKKLGLAGQDSAGADEWPRLRAELDEAVQQRMQFHPDEDVDQAEDGCDRCLPDGKWHLDGKTLAENQVPLARIRTQREALLELRSTGTYSSHTLSTALAELDAEEMSIQVRVSEEE